MYMYLFGFGISQCLCSWSPIFTDCFHLGGTGWGLAGDNAVQGLAHWLNEAVSIPS